MTRHILHVVQLYDPVKSGAARYFHEIGARLVREGHRVTVLATDAHDLEHLWMAGRRWIAEPETIIDGVRVVRLATRRAPGPALVYPALRRMMLEIARIPGTTPLLRQLAQLTPTLPRLGALLRSPRFADVALVHAANITLDFMLLPAQHFAAARSIPFVCTPFVHLGEPEHDTIRRYYTMRHQIDLLRRADRTLTMTNIERDALMERGVPAERLHTVGAGVDPADVTGGDAVGFRAEHQIAGSIVLFIGSLARDKGAIDTVEAMQHVWARGGDATLVLIGAPLQHFSAYIERLTATTRARLRILPYASDTVRRNALAAADVFALPSRTDSFGIVYLEAWCNGLPVIGARAGGVPGVIRDGVDGLLVPYGDPTALAAALDRLLRDAALRRQFGVAGRVRALGEYTWDAVYERVRAVYGEVGV